MNNKKFIGVTTDYTIEEKVNTNPHDAWYISMLTKLLVNKTEVMRSNKVVSLITYKNRVVSFGENSGKSSPMQAKFGKNCEAIYLHAEIDAIKGALREIEISEFSKCTIYTCRSFSNNIMKKAKPCSGCLRAILHFGIKRVVFSIDDSSIGELIIRR